MVRLVRSVLLPAVCCSVAGISVLRRLEIVDVLHANAIIAPGVLRPLRRENVRAVDLVVLVDVREFRLVEENDRVVEFRARVVQVDPDLIVCDRNVVEVRARASLQVDADRVLIDQRVDHVERLRAIVRDTVVAIGDSRTENIDLALLLLRLTVQRISDENTVGRFPFDLSRRAGKYGVEDTRRAPDPRALVRCVEELRAADVRARVLVDVQSDFRAVEKRVVDRRRGVRRHNDAVRNVHKLRAEQRVAPFLLRMLDVANIRERSAALLSVRLNAGMEPLHIDGLQPRRRRRISVRGS